MSHTNSTANLSLPQFIGSDKPTWLGDVNGAFSAIDSYAGTNDAAVAAAASDASSAISQASAAVSTANSANTTAGNASTAANNAVGVANNAVAIAGTVDSKVGLLADLTTTDRTSIVNAINEVNAAAGTVPTATQVTYDNTVSGLTATNVQAAIDEVAQGGGGSNAFTLIDTKTGSTPIDITGLSYNEYYIMVYISGHIYYSGVIAAAALPATQKVIDTGYYQTSSSNGATGVYVSTSNIALSYVYSNGTDVVGTATIEVYGR